MEEKPLSDDLIVADNDDVNVLVIGGTRNLGPGLVERLAAEGARVTVIHRGVTKCRLPEGVEEIFADRSNEDSLRSATAGREFGTVIDMTLYTGADAEAAARIFAGRCGRYVMISTGQVYLVRQGPIRPFRESDYAGPVTPAPDPADEFEYDNWTYGAWKRDAEDALMRALPVTVLRFPMINSERDHHGRIHGYLCRMADGGPIVIPSGPHLPLRHVYGDDAVEAIVRAATGPARIGEAFNIGQDETVTITDFLAMLSELAGLRLRIHWADREMLMRTKLLPACSPFSEPWMSSLDNRKSIEELGMKYTPVAVYLRRLVENYRPLLISPPPGYARRAEEISLENG